MNKGDIVKTTITRGNCKDPVSIIVEEIQKDAFSDRHSTLRGRRVYKNGKKGKTVIDCPLSKVAEKV